jgi:hypothetical protein
MAVALPVDEKLRATEMPDMAAEVSVAVGGGGARVLIESTGLQPELAVGASALMRNS